MTTDDPFSNSGFKDRTVVRPRPGGRRSDTRSTVPPRPVEPPRIEEPLGLSEVVPPSRSIVEYTGTNPLLRAAAGLFLIITRIRGSASHHDVDGLRQRVASEIRAFEAGANAEGVSKEFILAARYALCTLLDEVVLNTPWGAESTWGRQTLLSALHNETWGGEKFFLILDRLETDPSHNLDLMEFMFVCLSLGFQGKYRVRERGQNELEEIRARLFQHIYREKGSFERELSPHWQGVVDLGSSLARQIPVWVVGTVGLALLVVVYLGFSISLNSYSDPVFAKLDAIGRLEQPTVAERDGTFAQPPLPDEQQHAVIEQPQRQAFQLSAFLAPEVQQGLLNIEERGDSTRIVIHGGGLFRSGSATVAEEIYPVLDRIAEGLTNVTGSVVVSGHTDNVPIRSLRFRSNWDLSRQRASAVADRIGLTPGLATRLTVEGRADTEPLVPNDTPENRARNRRVGITVFSRPVTP